MQQHFLGNGLSSIGIMNAKGMHKNWRIWKRLRRLRGCWMNKPLTAITKKMLWFATDINPSTLCEMFLQTQEPGMCTIDCDWFYTFIKNTWIDNNVALYCITYDDNGNFGIKIFGELFQEHSENIHVKKKDKFCMTVQHVDVSEMTHTL